MRITCEGVLFLEAEEKSFKKGEETINYVTARILDDENESWELSVERDLRLKVLSIENRSIVNVEIQAYKVKFEGKENTKLRLVGIEVVME